MIRPSILFGILALFLPLVYSVPVNPLKRNNDSPSVGQILDDETRQWWQSAMDEWGVTGAAIAIITPEGEGLEFFGAKDWQGSPITPDTYFSIGSNSKWVTSLAAATIESWGNIKQQNGENFSLDSKVRDVYPEFSMKDPNATENATVAQMFGMMTGVPRHDFAIGAHDTAFDAFHRLSLLNATVPFPSEVQQYATIHYNALSALPEILLGRTLADFVEHDIWGPLGIDATFNATWAKETGRMANGFSWAGVNNTQCGLDIVANVSVPDSACIGRAEAFEFWTAGDGMEQGGGGAVIMTPEAMLKWSKESLRPTVIPQAALDTAYNRYDFPVAGNVTYSMGVNKNNVSGVEIAYHGGAVPGHNSFFARNVEKGYSVFAVVNLDQSFFWVNNYALQLLERLMGLPIDKDPNESLKASLAGSALVASVSGLVQSEYLPDLQPPPSRDDYANKVFTNDAYPELRLQHLDLGDSDAIEAAGISPDLVLKELPTYGGPVFFNPGVEAYVAEVDASFYQRILFTHFDGPLFNYTVLSIKDKIGTLDLPNHAMPQDYDSKHVVRVFGGGPCVFAEGGVGMFGTYWAGDAPQFSVPPKEDNVRGSAIVFYAAQE